MHFVEYCMCLKVDISGEWFQVIFPNEEVFISITFCILTTKIMNDGELSINLYFYNLMTDARLREVVKL
jgi:hypothetical protein